MSAADADSITLTGADIAALRRVLDAVDNFVTGSVDGAIALDALLDAHTTACADRDRDDEDDDLITGTAPLVAEAKDDRAQRAAGTIEAADQIRVGDPDPYPIVLGATCGQRGPRGYYRCTRPADHPGQHLAGTAIEVVAVWAP